MPLYYPKYHGDCTAGHKECETRGDGCSGRRVTGDDHVRKAA